MFLESTTLAKHQYPTRLCWKISLPQPFQATGNVALPTLPEHHQSFLVPNPCYPENASQMIGMRDTRRWHGTTDCLKGRFQAIKQERNPRVETHHVNTHTELFAVVSCGPQCCISGSDHRPNLHRVPTVLYKEFRFMVHSQLQWGVRLFRPIHLVPFVHKEGLSVVADAEDNANDGI